MDFKEYFQELKKRKVFKAAIAYLVVAWVIIEVSSAIFPVFNIPPFILQILIVFLALGFIVNLIFSWVYDVTPEGLKKTIDIKETESPSRIKNRRLNRVIIASLSLAVVLLLYNQFGRSQSGLSQSVDSDGSTDALTASIAVLPFKNWSGDPGLEYVSDGMADEIATKLERAENMERVVPFAEMLQYKQSQIKLKELTDSLQVQFILDGSVQIAGEEIRVKVQLLDGYSNRYVWSEEFTGIWDSKDVFEIQSNVTNNVLERIHKDIRGDIESDQDYVLTESMEAYRYFLKGLHQLRTQSEENVNKGIANFQKAVELDPNFIEAWYNLGMNWMFSGLYWGINPERLAWENTKTAWEKVIELAEGESDYEEVKVIVENALLWNYLFYDWDFDRIEKVYGEEFVDPVGFRSVYELYTGRYEESLETNEEGILRASENGIMSSRGIPLKAASLFFLGREAEAEDLLTEYIEILWDSPAFLTEAAKWYYYLGNYDQSRKALNRLKSAFGDNSPLILFLSAVHAYEENMQDELKESLVELESKYRSQKSGSPAWHLALYYSHAGEYESCMEWLQKSFEKHETEMVWLRSEPLLAPIRNDPRYLNMYKEVGFPVPPLAVPEDLPQSIN
ncbi:hypothetical protein [Robiginitalea sp. SC105]|uniref:TPR end-of-group domain-containing protein n=1 Tax=Robiginitalea sp. SC105 TaxID=2762332 RepID=UPI00163A189C|nr:hypothetical protein [Robiginitalea sp. SC105]MBC2840090.1 hypothetical protein [Robiginitalea sp. SC105]